MTDTICYARESITPLEFRDILLASGLARRRPVDNLARLATMIDNAGLIITARHVGTGELAGIARSLTDWSYACYLSDLAVDARFQGQGIGRMLIEETRRHAGSQSMCLLVSAPDSVEFYERIGMPRCERAFLFPREE